MAHSTRDYALGMIVRSALIILPIATGALGTAHADQVLLEADVMFVGDPGPSLLTLTIDIDGSQADENPAQNLFLATSHGDYDGSLDGPFFVPLVGTFDRIVADADVGAWQAEFVTVVGQALIPTTIVLNGIGLVGDQSLPLFNSFTGGTVTADASILGIGIGTGPVTSFAVVPEPGTVVLFGLGLFALGVRRVDRSSAPRPPDSN